MVLGIDNKCEAPHTAFVRVLLCQAVSNGVLVCTNVSWGLLFCRLHPGYSVCVHRRYSWRYTIWSAVSSGAEEKLVPYNGSEMGAS
jgi:hypothetical protein